METVRRAINIPHAMADDILKTCVPSLVAKRARSAPAQIALSSESEELNYGDLDRRASRLAAQLQKLGAKPEAVVGVCLERSTQFVVAALAILKSGAAYLPLDPAYPTERLRFIADDAGIRLLITNSNLSVAFAGCALELVDIEVKPPSGDLIDPQVCADHLAYVIYTSGSTGQPKGVEVTHENLSHLVAWHLRAFQVGSADRTTFHSGIGFDAAVWDIWPSLVVGATLCLPNESTRLSAGAMRDWILKEQINIAFVPTAIAEQLLDLSWPAESALRFLLTGADTLHRYPPPGLPFAFVNNYGPTECTVVTTSGIIPPHENRAGPPSIGAPIDRIRVRILDGQGREVAPGTTGEIFIGGAGVARGYRNRPGLTGEHFVGEPRMYRTGDLGRFLPDGEILFLGRMDDQVKIRGYRIELEEINALLRQEPSVEASVVIVREDTPNDKRLVAYLVARNGEPDEEALRIAIRRRLPDYMEPSAFVWLETLPLTPNGKVDRAALPRPALPNDSYVAPRNPLEETLARIMAQVLKLERIGIDDDFFQLGAHSLLGAQVVARVRDEFGVELKLLDVFDAPTVAELAQKIEQALTAQLAAMSDAEVDAALARASDG